MLFAIDSQRQCEEKVGEGRGEGGMKGNLTSERLSLDRASPQPSGSDQSPSDGQRTAQEAQSRAKELF